MGRNSFISNFNKHFYTNNFQTLAFFLVFVIIIEIIIFATGPSFNEYSSDRGRLQNNAIISRTKEQHYDIIVFGDSASVAAFNTDLLTQLTGTNCLHMGAARHASVASSYFLFCEYVKNNEAPRYIILMNTYTGWELGVQEGILLPQLVKNFPVEMVTSLGNTQIMDSDYLILISGIIPYVLPSMHYRFSIERMLNDKINAPLMEFLGHHRDERISTDRPNIKSVDDFAAARKKNLIAAKKTTSETKFQVSKWNSIYLNKLILKANETGTKLLIAFPPAHKEIYNDSEYNGYLLSCKDFLDKQADSFENVLLLTDDFYVVTDNQTTNSDNHLNSEAADIYTAIIAEKILRLINSTDK